MNNSTSTPTFPTEIILHIAKYLSSLDILSLSLVSKSFGSCTSLLTSDRTEIFKRTEKLNQNSLIRLASLLAEANKYGRELARFTQKVELNMSFLLESLDPGSPRYRGGKIGFPFMLHSSSPAMFDEALVNVVADILTKMTGIEEFWIDMDPICANHLPLLAQFLRHIQPCLKNVIALELHNYRPRFDPQNTALPPNNMDLIINMLDSAPNLKIVSLDKVVRFDYDLEQALSKCTGIVKLTLAIGEFSNPHGLTRMLSSWPSLQAISLSVNHAPEDLIPDAVDLIAELCPLIHSVHLILPISGGILNDSGQRVLDAICRLIERHPGGLKELSVARLPYNPYTAQLRVIATACPNLEIFSLTSRHPYGVVGEGITQVNWPRMRYFNLRVYELPIGFLKAVLTQTPLLEDAQFTLRMTPDVTVLKEAGFVLEGKKDYCGDNYWSYRRGNTKLRMTGRWNNDTLENTILNWSREYSGTLNSYISRVN